MASERILREHLKLVGIAEGIVREAVHSYKSFVDKVRNA